MAQHRQPGKRYLICLCSLMKLYSGNQTGVPCTWCLPGSVIIVIQARDEPLFLHCVRYPEWTVLTLLVQMQRAGCRVTSAPSSACPSAPAPFSALSRLCVPAAGRVSHRAAPAVHRLAGIQGHPSLQTLPAEGGQEAGEVAGAVRRQRRAHCGPLPVSRTGKCLQPHTMLREESWLWIWKSGGLPGFSWGKWS